MDGYRDIAEKCFWAGGGNDYLPYPVEGRIGNLVEFGFFVFVCNFDIRKAGLVCHAEVNHSFATVNELIVPELFEGGIDSFNDLFIEGEDEVVPAGAYAEGPQLKFHIATLLINKVPYLAI